MQRMAQASTMAKFNVRLREKYTIRCKNAKGWNHSTCILIEDEQRWENKGVRML